MNITFKIYNKNYSLTKYKCLTVKKTNNIYDNIIAVYFTIDM